MPVDDRQAWERVRLIIDQAVGGSGRSSTAPSPREVAEALERYGIQAEDVRDWRRGRTRPPLTLLAEIASVLDIDPLAFAKAFGLLGPLSDRALDVHTIAEGVITIRELETRVSTLERALSDAESYANGAARIVALARASRKWAVAVWPAVEGPEDCRIHMADRLTIRQLDERPINLAELKSDLGPALRSAHAIHVQVSPAAGWPSGPGIEDRWSIPVFTSPQPPLLDSGWAVNTRSVGIITHTARSWGSDVAGLLAWALGFGLTGTRHLVERVTTETTAAEMTTRRIEFARMLVKRPMDRHVWFHADFNADGLLTAALPAPEKNHALVRLREDDDLVAYGARWCDPVVTGRERHEDVLKRWMAARRRADACMGGRDDIITIELGLPDGVTLGTPLNSETFRSGALERSLQTALTVLKLLEPSYSPMTWPDTPFRTWALPRW